ncbi:MAG TPA: hypothetical protein VGK64_03490 [Bryobacteraceae bacterium]
MLIAEETKRALIVVRTYPTPSRSGVEVSCTAAITDKQEWLRLFPVPWRLLDADKRFRKYQWVDVTVTKARDGRPESYKLKPDGISIVTHPLGTENYWARRKEIVFPVRSESLCELVRRRDLNGHPTLGFFKPKLIEALSITPESPNWTQAQTDALRQGHLFLEKPEKELEKIPLAFRYEFCCNDQKCSGHKMICTDWEMAESYRKWKADYGANWEEKFRQRYESEMISKNDTHFYVGTLNKYPNAWIIIGLFYPPHEPDPAQRKLF